MSPYAAPRPCSKLGCAAHATKGAYCTDHERSNAERYDRTRGKTKARGYGGRWQKVRSRKIKRDPMCEHCGKVAVDVDHITPIKQGGAQYDPANLQTLCRRCHNIKTAGER